METSRQFFLKFAPKNLKNLGVDIKRKDIKSLKTQEIKILMDDYSIAYANKVKITLKNNTIIYFDHVPETTASGKYVIKNLILKFNE